MVVQLFCWKLCGYLHSSGSGKGPEPTFFTFFLQKKFGGGSDVSCNILPPFPNIIYFGFSRFIIFAML
jgi:hypothetical protein